MLLWERKCCKYKRREGKEMPLLGVGWCNLFPIFGFRLLLSSPPTTTTTTKCEFLPNQQRWYAKLKAQLEYVCCTDLHAPVSAYYAKFLHQNSVEGLLRVRCWLGEGQRSPAHTAIFFVPLPPPPPPTPLDQRQFLRAVQYMA